MRHVIDNQFVLARAPEGPLAAWLDGFARFLSAKGYAASTIRQRVQRAVSFSYWLKQEQTELSDLTSDHPALYLQDRALQVTTRRNFLAGLRQLLEFLRLEGVVAEEPAADSPTTQVDQCVHAYEQYLRDMRGLVDLTIESRSPVVRRFLEHRFGDGQVTLPQLSASDVVEFVQREVSPQRSGIEPRSSLSRCVRFLDTCGIAAKPCRTWSPPFRRSHSGPWPRYLVQSPLTRFSSS